MTILKDFFTININCRFFIPTIKDNGLTYSIEYNRNKSTGVMSFCIVKKDRTDLGWKAIKRGIKDDIYNRLKERGVY